nr:HPr family phosphocarrier protein [uncultured Caproiciproducens sp.]
MMKFDILIRDALGIHARPAGALVKTAKSFSSVITLEKTDGKAADMKKLFDIMGLAVKKGDKVTVTASGADETAAIQKIRETFETYL